MNSFLNEELTLISKTLTKFLNLDYVFFKLL